MPRPYALRGLVRCAACGRKMQGTWNHDRAHYCCRFLTEYAIANRVEQTAAVHLREDAVLPQLDAWLGAAFGPPRLAAELSSVVDVEREPDPETDAARRAIAECDQKLARHRAAL